MWDSMRDYECLYFVGFSGSWKGYLGFDGCTSITHLPDGLSVGGNLGLHGSGIKKDGFKKPKGVNGYVFY